MFLPHRKLNCIYNLFYCAAGAPKCSSIVVARGVVSKLPKCLSFRKVDASRMNSSRNSKSFQINWKHLIAINQTEKKGNAESLSWSTSRSSYQTYIRLWKRRVETNTKRRNETKSRQRRGRWGGGDEKKTMSIWSNLMDESANLWMPVFSVRILRRFNGKRWIGIIILE